MYFFSKNTPSSSSYYPPKLSCHMQHTLSDIPSLTASQLLKMYIVAAFEHLKTSYRKLVLHKKYHHSSPVNKSPPPIGWFTLIILKWVWFVAISPLCIILSVRVHCELCVSYLLTKWYIIILCYQVYRFTRYMSWTTVAPITTGVVPG